MLVKSMPMQEERICFGDNQKTKKKYARSAVTLRSYITYLYFMRMRGAAGE